MSDLLAQIVPLALAAAISPVLFLLQLNTLTGERPLAPGSALTAGAGVVLIIGSSLGRRTRGNRVLGSRDPAGGHQPRLRRAADPPRPAFAPEAAQAEGAGLEPRSRRALGARSWPAA